MLPGRIELTTSPLPRECSTTELRQRARVAFSKNRPSWPPTGGRFLPQGLRARKRAKATGRRPNGAGHGPVPVRLGGPAPVGFPCPARSMPSIRPLGRRPQPKGDAGCQSPCAAVAALHVFRASSRPVNSRNMLIMADEDDKRDVKAAPRDRESRQQRLKLALRDNLRRRKSQARERGKMPAQPSNDHDGALDDDT